MKPTGSTLNAGHSGFDCSHSRVVNSATALCFTVKAIALRQLKVCTLGLTLLRSRSFCFCSSNCLLFRSSSSILCWCSRRFLQRHGQTGANQKGCVHHRALLSKLHQCIIPTGEALTRVNSLLADGREGQPLEQHSAHLARLSVGTQNTVSEVQAQLRGCRPSGHNRLVSQTPIRTKV